MTQLTPFLTQSRPPDLEWPIRLFNKSVLKQRKYKEIVTLLGPSRGLRCLDIGADNGVISYLLRQRGGLWFSTDLDEPTVKAIHSLVRHDVSQIDGESMPFQDHTFDRIVIVDFLEHIPNDQAFVKELHRILKPDGELIINTPHLKDSLLRRFRLTIGQTDEKHGHLRPGYTETLLRDLLGPRFRQISFQTYSKFFSECVDTFVVFGVSLVKRNKSGQRSRKGMIVTGQDLEKGKSMFKLYSLIYPLFWLAAQLDHLLFFTSGYAMIAKVKPAADSST